LFYVNEEFFLAYANQKDNDPCVCGSGKNFKDCHKPQFSNEKVRPEMLYFRGLKNSNKIKFCLFSCEDCVNPIVKAHSISKQFISQIAEEQHVLTFLRSIQLDLMDDLHKEGILPSPEIIGVNDATTFMGFCSYHDKELFKSFEEYPFVGSIDQISALHLRAVAKEIYVKKDMILRQLDLQRDLGKVSSKEGTINKSIAMAQTTFGNNLAVRDLWQEFNDITNYLNSTTKEKLNYIIVEISGQCNVLNSSIVNPAFDFGGRMIQNYDDQDLYVRSFGFNVIVEGGRYFYIFTWFDTEVINNFMKGFFRKYK